jgi:D-sedoheptulose 7-phosphate isomerase
MKFAKYAHELSQLLVNYDWDLVKALSEKLFECWESGRQVFFCGNGGSAGNAVHLANDFLYGIACNVDRPGMRVEALSANTAVLTCLANDVGYAQVFAEQIRVKAEEGDLLVVLSGSGNSENIVKALELANDLKLDTCAILGFSGGRCLTLADLSIHFPVNDMQMSEDLQLIVGHMCMQYLSWKALEVQNGSIEH